MYPFQPVERQPAWRCVSVSWEVSELWTGVGLTYSDPSNGTTSSLVSEIPKPGVTDASHCLFHGVHPLNSPPTPLARPLVSSALPLAFNTPLEIVALGSHAHLPLSWLSSLEILALRAIRLSSTGGAGPGFLMHNTQMFLRYFLMCLCCFSWFEMF